MSASVLQITAVFIFVLLFGLLIGRGVTKLSRKWDEYDERVRIKFQAKQRQSLKPPVMFRGSGSYPIAHTPTYSHWNVYKGKTVWPFAKLALCDVDFTFTMPGLEVVKNFSQIHSINLSRFGYVTFHFNEPTDSFSFKCGSPAKLLDVLRRYGVSVEDIGTSRIRIAQVVIILPFIAIIAPTLLLSLLLISDEITNGDILRVLFFTVIMPLLTALKVPSSKTLSMDDSTLGDDW